MSTFAWPLALNTFLCFFLSSHDHFLLDDSICLSRSCMHFTPWLGNHFKAYDHIYTREEEEEKGIKCNDFPFVFIFLWLNVVVISICYPLSYIERVAKLANYSPNVCAQNQGEFTEWDMKITLPAMFCFMSSYTVFSSENFIFIHWILMWFWKFYWIFKKILKLTKFWWLAQ